MRKPVSPCKKCTIRGINCKGCQKEKLYEILRQEFYNQKLLSVDFENSRIERYNKLYHKNLKFKKGNLK